MPVYDVQCSQAHVPAPIVIVAPHGVVDSADTVAPATAAFLHAGFVVVTVVPTGLGDDAEDRVAYTERLSTVIAEVADHPSGRCPTTGDVVLWGVNRGGAASVGVRDAHVRAIVALFVMRSCKGDPSDECDGPAGIPTLVIEGESRARRDHVTLLVVPGARMCDLEGHAETCLPQSCQMPSLSQCYRTVRELKTQTSIREFRIERQRVMIDRSVAWLTTQLAHTFDPATWPSSIEVTGTEGATHTDTLTRALISIPFELGITTDGEVAIGIRPELVIARTQARSIDSIGPGWGVAGYAELGVYGRHDGPVVAGGGLSVVRYGHEYAVAPSVGGYWHGNESGVALGLFTGLRGYLDTETFDTPTGLRIDARLGTGGSTERTVVVSAVVDLPGMIIGLQELYAFVGHAALAGRGD